MISELRKRVDDCPAGGVFYFCNGFRGCCTIDPCNPGSTCPADKDLTPGRSSAAVSKTSTASSSRVITTPTPISTTTSSSSASTTSSTDASGSPSFTPSIVEPTAFKTVTQSISGTTTTTIPTATPAPSNPANSTPIAAIVGAVLGTIVLIVLLLSIFFCMRKKRRTKVYKAPAYPSPLVGSDMTPQLSSKASSQFQQKIAALYSAESMTERCDPQQLDGREISRYERHRHGSIGRFAELPAEPLPWPGNSGNR
ncbi:hypothetical protein BDW02DRAFT_91878 [Decorospora gaudefroyi]|uniref:Mid2 domain-containing protein n=1 Tax=Decorospora gaudefroyi TaxID=184978 RepID=A0A6A5K3H3_9PLEO|nr:hypothetical protein BDW02DRAFT_91878 [Decorospora gaudefroyi]